ncbi:hypothetical protein DXN04_24475 [Chitinophaga silvisoli]|uniref:PA14 domain-containing protein n=2 Tax=Chitinophaga silvisoli TaxID=2291814 RepID=A0A3E1NVL1_9BACT|nr:hypothetical protein DXN04_24475 [Chitinophaga silvisoli]
MFLLCVLGTQLLLSNAVYALTTGPSQPEMKGFEPAGTENMVDLFSGDFNYSIPLISVDGYPINMAYHSGSGMDDEASWVGLGWSLNPGVVNRQMRGIPDDFDGDPVIKEFNMKQNTTAGLKLVASPEFFGFGKAKISLNAGIFKNSYRGYGAEVGVNATIGLTNSGAGAMTVGLNSNSQSGVDVSANVNFSMQVKSGETKDVSPGLSVGSSYNSRSGIKGLTLSASADYMGKEISSTETSFNFASPAYTPSSTIAFSNESYTLSGSLGPAIMGVYGKLGFTGYYNKQTVANKRASHKSYGFLHAEKGKSDINGLMDFNREKDMPYNDQLPYLPLPVPTYDLFSVSNQSTSGQFRVFRNGSGIFFDPKTEDKNGDVSLGVEVGAGAYFQAGVDLNGQSLTTRTNKWSSDNDYSSKGDFQAADAANPVFEPAYFKRSGEKSEMDTGYYSTFQREGVAGINTSLNGEKTRALAQWKTKSGVVPVSQAIKRNKRETRQAVFSYLTASEANKYGLDKTIKSYPANTLVLQCDDSRIENISRLNTNAKSHHMSQVTVLDNNGSRYIYGIPAYNTYQEEVSFSVDAAKGDRNTGLVGYTSQDASASNNQGRDGYYSKDIMPAYAHSFLLTGMLTSDYVDVTGNGISDDDLGNAVKFNYTRQAGLFGWRTPFDKDKANYNESMRSDKRDDRGSYVYGTKEIWYTHSIEGRTMIALFILGDREDGMGAKDNTGGIDTDHHQRYLDRIELYSKADLQQNGSAAVPVKTVHFEYDYSSCPGVTNNSGKAVMKDGVNINAQKGKLTLRKVYFTFGKNGKGILQPYKFNYQQTINGTIVNYSHKQADRWGTYKDNQANEGALNNDEFPYTIQDKTKADAYAAMWQLNDIELPAGGHIKLDYEADDYAYVQDKRAQQMCFVKGIDNAGQKSGLINARRLLIKLPQPVSNLAEMKYRYFEGMTNLYYRLYVNLDNAGHYEYVPGYGTITNVSMVDNTTAAVELLTTDGAHPAASAAWQFLRMNLPLYAYPNSETSDQGDFKAIIRSLITAVSQLSELVENFNTRASRKKFGDQIDLSRSWVRLNSPSFAKLGGGSRVKSLRMVDNWKSMSGTGQDASFGQDYSYTTTANYNGQDITISSGVTPYEPMIGNDENPFRQPFPYTKKGNPLGLSDHYYMEAPLGESYFPPGNVGYSKVTVYNVGQDGNRNLNGYNVSEFYTAKDFPTIVNSLPIDAKPYKPSPLLNFLKMKFKSGVVLTQGYSIEVNDMHGKPKQEAFYKRGTTSPMSSTKYFYKTVNETGGKQLDNNVLLVRPDGSLQDASVGVDIEMFSDMREQYTQNIGGSLRLSFGSFPIVFFPGAYVFPGVGFNQDYREYRSTSTVKLVQRSGIMYKQIKTQDGSSITTEMMAWDPTTGEPLLKKEQNEFDDAVYNFTYPAYWAYNGMSQAFQNIDVVLKGVSTDNTGRFLTSVPAGILFPGDEVIDLNGTQQAWVMKGSDGQLKLIDKSGEFVVYSNASLRIVRSGHRNLSSAMLGAVSSLRNPIKSGKIDIGAFSRVINASANTFKEEWQVALRDINAVPPAMDTMNLTCPLSYITGFLFAIADPTLPYNSTYLSAANRQLLNEQYIFKGKNSNVTLRNIIDKHRSFGLLSGSYPLSSYFTEPFFNKSQPASLRFYVNHPRYRMKCGEKYFYFNSGDTITLGSYILVLKDVHPYLNDAINGYPWLNSDGTSGYYTGNTSYNTGDSCGCNGTFGYNNTSGEKIQLVRHEFKDISLDGQGCNIVPDCPTLLGSVVNPYFTNMLGNWRPYQKYVYRVDRKAEPNELNKAKGATDLRNSGYYANFTPFWQYDGSAGMYKAAGPAADEKWIYTSEAVKVDTKSKEIETKNAIGIYSGAIFGYANTVPIAVSANAAYHEIGFDGFEDYQFEKVCGVWPDSCKIEGHFDFRREIWHGIQPDQAYAHTGNYSLKLSKPVTMKREIPLPFTPGSFSAFDSQGRFIATVDNTYPKFYPTANKMYIASVWVKSSNVNANTTGVLQIGSNTSLQPIVVSQGAGVQIEGWRKVEVSFVMPDNARQFLLTLDPKGGEAWFDDVRIQPFNSHMQTYVYVPSRTDLLMAELDENNFATLYEYDDEGTLIRLKRETERGIMTVKESRSYYKKH